MQEDGDDEGIEEQRLVLSGNEGRGENSPLFGGKSVSKFLGEGTCEVNSASKVDIARDKTKPVSRPRRTGKG